MNDYVALTLGVLCAGMGGELFVRGLVGIAHWARISAGIIGATVAAFATSSPELSVAISSAMAKKPEISLGDALGSNVALILGIAIVMIAMNAGLALLTLTFVPLLAYVALEFGRRFRPLSAAIQQQVAELTTCLEQNLRGARIVKAFAQEPAEVDGFDRENDWLFDLNLRASRMRAWVLPLLNLVASAATILVLLYGGCCRLIWNAGE